MKEESLADKVFILLIENPERIFSPTQLAAMVRERWPDYAKQKKEKSRVINNDKELIYEISRLIHSSKQAIYKKDPTRIKLYKPLKLCFNAKSESSSPSSDTTKNSQDKKVFYDPSEGKTLNDKIFILLNENRGKTFHPKELASMVCERWPEYVKQKKEKSSVISNDKELVDRITQQIYSRKHKIKEKAPNLIELLNPLQFRLTNPSDIPLPKPHPPSRLNNKRNGDIKQLLSEEKLYDKLRIYLKSTGIYSIRINERTSSNNRSPKGNHWLHPDIVGIEELSTEWISEVQYCVKACYGQRVRLWSFEVKKDAKKLREYYQQAVSNSSWANFGYLVAPKIEPKDKRELNILFSLHGIGFIELNVENPEESQIIIPAKERPDIDWNMVNRIAVQNKPFKKNYVGQIRRIYETTGQVIWGDDWKIKKD